MIFEKKYFVQSTVSNYEDYREKKYEYLVNDLISFFPARKSRILDFGCATGGLLNQLKHMGYSQLKGTDISYWAIDYGKKVYGLANELEYYNVNLLTELYDYILFLDVLEHIPTVEEIQQFLSLITASRIIVRLPVSAMEGEPYILSVSNNDVTHVQCHTKEWWEQLFSTNGFILETILEGIVIYDSQGVLARIYRRKNE